MLSRISAVRAIPRAFATRSYVTGRTEGSVAQSKGFNKKEKAHEGMRLLLEQLEKLRAQIKAKQAEIDSLEKQHDELEQSAKKN
ncbi:hypothetical protein D9613_003740 [Agrocybe pediades]|uniref:Mitochondrial ATPase inhibitor n=1 Tax=Agrocybe pediades TaxID=84607 RepID=A0A8H4QJT4_9AGAR|nr:hypothetical protein D9613_003740 [Agrocybe pediades]